MCGSAPSASPVPNPYKVAGAQQGADIWTAIANNYMGNANVSSPYGSSTFSQIPGSAMRIPIPGGKDAMIHQYQQEIQLSPEQQKLLQQQNNLSQSTNSLALNQIDRLKGVLNDPVSFKGSPRLVSEIPNNPNFAQQQTTFGDAGDIQRGVGADDFSADRMRVEEALMARLNPQIDRDRSALEAKLVNQGLARDSEAFKRAIDEVNRSATDARMQAVLAGGQEQSRMFGMDLSQGQFANSAQQQAYDQELGRGQFGNMATAGNNAMSQQEYANRMSEGQFQNQARQQSIQEMLAKRNQPINEIATLMGKGQVTMPQFAGWQGNAMAPPPIAQSVYNSAALQNQQYAQQNAANNAAMGGLYGLGSTGISAAMMMSDRRLKERIVDTGLKLKNGLKLYAYSYLGEAKRRIGLIAQEVEKVVPDAVRDVGGFMAVDYSKALEAR